MIEARPETMHVEHPGSGEPCSGTGLANIGQNHGRRPIRQHFSLINSTFGLNSSERLTVQ